MIGVLRLLGGVLGIGVLLAFLAVIIWAAMWAILLAVRHIPAVGRRHRHVRWSEMQQEGNRIAAPHETSLADD